MGGGSEGGGSEMVNKGGNWPKTGDGGRGDWVAADRGLWQKV